MRAPVRPTEPASSDTDDAGGLPLGRVDADAVRPLRAAVLRPGQPAHAVVWDGDDDPDAVHVAVRAGRQVVAVGSLLWQPPPWAPHGPALPRVRGMATAGRWRGHGLGARVLRELLAAAGEATVWANVRVGAHRLYERFGFEARGAPWDDPQLGPHVLMVRPGEPRRGEPG